MSNPNTRRVLKVFFPYFSRLISVERSILLHHETATDWLTDSSPLVHYALRRVIEGSYLIDLQEHSVEYRLMTGISQHPTRAHQHYPNNRTIVCQKGGSTSQIKGNRLTNTVAHSTSPSSLINSIQLTLWHQTIRHQTMQRKHHKIRIIPPFRRQRIQTSQGVMYQTDNTILLPCAGTTKKQIGKCHRFQTGKFKRNFSSFFGWSTDFTIFTSPTSFPLFVWMWRCKEGWEVELRRSKS